MRRGYVPLISGSFSGGHVTFTQSDASIWSRDYGFSVGLGTPGNRIWNLLRTFAPSFQVCFTVQQHTVSILGNIAIYGYK